MKISDVYGNIIEQSTLAPSEGEAAIRMNGEQWASGIYFIEITTGNQRIVRKIVKAD